jgi:hypothetical protein
LNRRAEQCWRTSGLFEGFGFAYGCEFKCQNVVNEVDYFDALCQDPSCAGFGCQDFEDLGPRSRDLFGS